MGVLDVEADLRLLGQISSLREGVKREKKTGLEFDKVKAEAEKTVVRLEERREWCEMLFFVLSDGTSESVELRFCTAPR